MPEPSSACLPLDLGQPRHRAPWLLHRRLRDTRPWVAQLRRRLNHRPASEAPSRSTTCPACHFPAPVHRQAHRQVCPRQAHFLRQVVRRPVVGLARHLLEVLLANTALRPRQAVPVVLLAATVPRLRLGNTVHLPQAASSVVRLLVGNSVARLLVARADNTARLLKAGNTALPRKAA